MENNEMTNKLVNYLIKLNEYYRPSHNELAACNYLLNWLQELQKENPGIKVETFQSVKTNDLEGFNIIVDVPATSGCEEKPRTIIQAHIDLVWVTREGHDKDKKVECIIEGNELKAKYSSLGADDGAGVAIAQYILKDYKGPHGPLRILLTVDEECDMTGASRLPAKYSQGCKYCINTDSQVVGQAFISSAGNESCKSLIEIATEAKNNEYKIPAYIKVSGGHGGHSGLDIAISVDNLKKNQGRANCLWWTNYILATLLKKKIDFKLGLIAQGNVVIDGNKISTDGNKMNSIPNHGESIIFLKDEKTLKKVNKIVTKTFKQLKKKHPSEDKINIELSTTNMPPYFDNVKNIIEEDKIRLISLINNMPQGIFEMSDSPEVAKTSCIVVINFSFDKTEDFIDYIVIATPRATSNQALDELDRKIKSAYIHAGLIEESKEAVTFSKKNSYMTHKAAHSWSTDENSELCKMVDEAWKKQSDKPIVYRRMHAGLECAYFYTANPELQIVSVGPTINNCHSVDEVLYIDTFAPTTQLIIDVLEMIAKQ